MPPHLPTVRRCALLHACQCAAPTPHYLRRCAGSCCRAVWSVPALPLATACAVLAATAGALVERCKVAPVLILQGGKGGLPGALLWGRRGEGWCKAIVSSGSSATRLHAGRPVRLEPLLAAVHGARRGPSEPAPAAAQHTGRCPAAALSHGGRGAGTAGSAQQQQQHRPAAGAASALPRCREAFQRHPWCAAVWCGS